MHAVHYLASVTIDPRYAYQRLMPVGAQLLSAELQSNGIIEIQYTACRRADDEHPPVFDGRSAPPLHVVWEFHQACLGEDLPKGRAWGMPVKLNSSEYLFYAIQP